MKRAISRIVSWLAGAVLLASLAFVAAPASTASDTTKKSFIASLVTAAQQTQRAYGVPAAASIAQAAIDSDWGTSSVATSANNLYGLHCTATMTADEFAKLAEAQVGKAYVLGAYAAITNADPKAFDCSELVKWLYGRSGNPITDLAADQYDATKAVSTSSPKTGDLVFLRNNPARANGIGHVAVVTKKLSNGDWEVIEARGHVDGVVKTTLSYWKQRSYFAGMRRYSKLYFAGQDGVSKATALSPYQASCATVGSTKYRKYSSLSDSVLDNGYYVANQAGYAAARAAMGNDAAYVDAVAKIEQGSDAGSYAKSVKAVIADYDLEQYDVAPLSVVLESGDTGAKVTALQYLLNAAGKSVKVSGKFDSSTETTVKSLQKSKSLDVDGQAGPDTLTALMTTLNPGDSGNAVSALKTLLGLAGYGTEAGNSLGATTTASLKAFQTSAGIDATGTTNAKTWSKLFMLLETAPTPTVAGTTTVGQTLTAAAGTWGPGSVDVSYQWLRGSDAINGATSASYVLAPEDANQVIKVTTTGSKATYTSVSRTSSGTKAITPAKLTSTPKPKITGTAKAGNTLTAVPGTWAPAPVTFGYQWYRGKTAITAATGATYQLQAADYKAKVTVAVTGSKQGYFSATQTSAATTAVAQGVLTASPNPTITGNASVGQTLTAVTGTWAPAPTGFSYTWYRDKTKIAKATKATYKVTAADAGHALKVKVTNTGPAFAAVSKYSAATATVPRLAWADAPNVKISGTAKVGKTLKATTGTWTPKPTFSYRWYRGSKAIKGATGASHKVTSADKGKTLTVTVTATRSGYSPVTKTVSRKIG